MKKYIFIFGSLLVLGFLFFNVSSNRSKIVVPPLTAALLCPPNCVPPTVITYPASSLTTGEATLNGEVTSPGGANLSKKGFQYGPDASYGSTVMDPTNAIGTFSANIASLSCGSTYHYRAYAINQQAQPQTGVGADASFATNVCHSSRGTITPSSTSSTTSTTTPPPIVPPVTTPVAPPPVISSTSTSSGTSSSSSFTPPIVPPIVPPVTPPSSAACNQGDKFSTATGLPCASYEATPIPNYPITGTLVYGSTGDEVKTLQAELNKDGFKSGPVDGIFGPITEGAVIRFQIAHKLAGDGIFGVNSRAAWENR